MLHPSHPHTTPQVDYVALMTKDRFVEVQAHLSFELPGSMRYPTDPFRKLRYVDKALLLAATWAWDPEPFACLDESRVATHSQYCPFRQQMMCKPIKDGLHRVHLCLRERLPLRVGVVPRGSCRHAAPARAAN